MKYKKTIHALALLTTFTFNPLAGQADEGLDQFMPTYQILNEKALKELKAIDILRSNHEEKNTINDIISETNDVTYELENCKNNNMDHEVYNLELIQEKEELQLKKERAEEKNKQLKTEINKQWF